jgi:Polyketide cyclase / dehydrase and lipid transport
MTTIHVVLASPLPPQQVLHAARDFSDRLEEIFPAVSVKRLAVHEQGATSADVTEGTRAGPVVNWERCHYDWSERGLVTATVTDSNVYALPSSWTITATATPGGSRVEMRWIREFRNKPRGRVFGTAFRLVGNRIFSRYARQTLQNIERLSRATQPPPTSTAST